MYYASCISASNFAKNNTANRNNSVNNTINNKVNNENLNNGNQHSNIINNNSANLKERGDTSLEEISPWLVRDNVIINKKPEKSKIPLLKTVITTEL